MKSDTERTSARAEKPTRSSSTQNVADTQTLFRLALNVEINPAKPFHLAARYVEMNYWRNLLIHQF